MIVKKEKNNSGIYDISFIEDNKIFKMIFGGNGDLYWALYDLNNSKLIKKCISEQFYITKENHEIYESFNTLYNDIKECNIFEFDEWDLFYCETEEEINEKIIEKQQRNKEMTNSSSYKMLFNNDIISWRSDDCYYENANIVNIIKEDNQFIIDFKLLEENDISIGNAIRFRNSGSRYDPFNILFMKQFNKLQNYDLDNHQIHMEEYIYQKTKK